jgi:hypothetical protein
VVAFQPHLQKRGLVNSLEHHEPIDAEIRRLVELVVAEAVVVVDVVGNRLLRRADRREVVPVERSSGPTTCPGKHSSRSS